MTRRERNETLKQALARAARTTFANVNSEEEEELTKLSTQRPDDLELIKDGSRSKVGAYRLASGRKVTLKYYYPTNIAKKIRNRIVGSHCKRSWIAAHGFAYLKIPTPQPLAVAEFHSLGLINSMSFLATDYIEGIQLRFLEQDRYKAIAPALKSALQTMAEHHVAHGDLKNTNIIVNSRNEIAFIDLDDTRFNLQGYTWKRARNYDQYRFQKNWRDNPIAASILNDCIA
ncbi:MAG: lipopolysaccharide kinase InaA family protein [Verrucomicrobiota bacterium]